MGSPEGTGTTDKALETMKHGAGVAAEQAEAAAIKVGTLLRAKIAEVAATDPSGDAADYLNSWNDTETRNGIVDFVESVTSKDNQDFIPIEERVAVFDNDGTLWSEQPMPVQLDFTVRVLSRKAEEDTSLRNKQPWKAAHEGNLDWFGGAVTKHYNGDDSDLKQLMGGINAAYENVSVERYREAAEQFFAEAEHPSLKRPYSKCAYKPMCELLDYLEANGFTIYIASGGDRDFMRIVAQELYGVPPERVIGSTQDLEYRESDDGVDIFYKTVVDVFDDGPTKPIRIWSRVGRRPVIAGGNSNGDIPMLLSAHTAKRPSLQLLVRHDDTDREFDYGAGAEDALARADQQGWTVISIKDDWNQVFAD